MVRSSPAIWDGHFCVGSYDSKIYCFSDNTTDQKDIEENKETKKPIEPPDTVKWEIFIDNGFTLDFAVTNETTTVLSRVDRYRNQLDCFDNANGELLWSRCLDFQSSLSEIISWEKNLIFQTNNDDGGNEIICIDPKTNQKIWGVLSSNILSESKQITLIEDILFFLKDGVVDAVNPATGELISEFQNYMNQFPIAVSENKAVYFENKTFRIFDRNTLTELPSIKPEIFEESRPWYSHYSRPKSSIIMSDLSDNRLLFLTKQWWWSKNTLFLFDLKTGDCLLTKTNTFCADFNDDYLVTTTPGNSFSFSSWDLSTGQNNWVKDGNYKTVLSPVFLADNEVIACNSKELTSLNLETGKENWTVQLPHYTRFFMKKIGIKFLEDGSAILLSSQHLTRITSSD